MWREFLGIKSKLIVTGLLLVCLLSAGCVSAQDFDNQLRSSVKPHTFSVLGWEFKAISDEIKQLVFSKEDRAEDESGRVIEYFSLVGQIKALKSEIETVHVGNGQDNLATLKASLNVMEWQKAALAGMVEKIIKKQIKETLAQQSIFNPLDKYIRLKVGFPPLNFRLEKPPYLLVISPRDRIESIREIPLKQDTSLEEIEDIEAKVDKLSVSSLVVELGGLGATYPTFVTNDSSLHFTIDTAVEEWLHQYLAFKPLGFLYVLDLTSLSRNYEIVTMNETIASMVSKEIGAMVYGKYYSEYGNGTNQNQASESESGFNREMREIRKTVDMYLAQGQIEQAEEFMEQKRQYLTSMGYYIRKLNQAYFAFHGTYADSPTSISPIGLELKELREQSASLKNFLSTVAAMTSRQDLISSIK